jgi:integrase
LALEWADIDWVVGTLTIRGTVFQGEKVLPKNGRFHQLMMTPPLRACFESVYLQRQVERSVDSGALSRWIFCSEQGTPIDGHNLRARWWTPLLAAAGLPPIRLHDLRGSVVSLLLNEGLTPWEVQSYIGHRSLVMTCNTYGHRYRGRAGWKTLWRSFCQCRESANRRSRSAEYLPPQSRLMPHQR